jgi:glyoxylase-like metal-dependent hydrolase (beta-lactamase superfamily II)
MKMKKILAISLAIFALSAGAILPFATPALADSMNGDDEVYLMVGDANRDYSGDFILVESNGKYGLIDAGTGNQELERQQAIYDFFDKKGITTFEFVILTHAHVDHISALTTVYGTETFSLFDKITSG